MIYRYFIYLLAFILSLAFLFSTMVYTQYQHQTENFSQRSLATIENKANLMTNDLRNIQVDLLYLSEDEMLRNLFNSSNKEADIKSLSKRFSNLVNIKQHYDQLRLIDHLGQETIRIDFKNDQSVIVNKEALQNKAQHYSFKEAISLSRKQIFISPLDLNIEHNQVEVPIKPMIRFATPIYNLDNKKVGVLILNYIATNLLKNFKQNTLNNPPDHATQLFLLNKNAYFMVGLSAEQEWSFMFKNHKQYKFSNQYPQAWSQILASKQGIYQNHQGIFSYTSISQVPLTSNPKKCPNCDWKAVAFTSKDVLDHLLIDESKKLTPAFLVFFLVGLVSFWILMRHSIHRLENETQLKRLHQTISNEHDIFITGPTIIFKWRDQYGWPIDYISENVQSVLGYSAKDFLNNELSYSSIVAPEFLSQIADDVAKAKQLKQRSFELKPYQVVDASGRRIWFRHYSTTFYDRKDKVSHYYGYVNDITQIKEAEERLKQSKDYVDNLLDTLPGPTVVIDIKNHHILLANHAAKELYNEGNLIPNGMTCHKLSHHRDSPCDSKDDPCPIREVLKSKKTEKVVHRHFINDGDEVFVELMSRPIFNAEGEVIQIIESQRDITHHVKNERRLTIQATTDPLTKAYNRLKLDSELALQLEIAKSRSIKLGLIMFDLDHFKQVNDTFGHDVGDYVLKEITWLARQAIRKTDILARWGGEEFMILLPETELSKIEIIAETLRTSIEQHYFKDVKQVTTSLGVTISKQKDSTESIIKRVDEALYESKENGRNRVTTHL
ncbi:MAG: diguanylate cyclase [Gammaproteobacteria bacterium]|nr:diguanylate cyclase [Gammaproteobacteria bacterium]